MRRAHLVLLAMGLVAAGLTPGQPYAQTVTDGSGARVGIEVAAGVAASIGRQVKDPGLARITGLRPGRAGAVCGEIDQTNRMGHYTGPRGFVADPASGFAGLSPEGPELRSPSSPAQYQAMQRALTLFRANCTLD